MILGQLYALALLPHPWPWPWSWNFKVKVWNSFYLRNGTADWHGTKKMWVIHSWPWYWLVWPWWGERMYRIVTGVTSDVGLPSTYPVLKMVFANFVTKKIYFCTVLFCTNIWFILHHQMYENGLYFCCDAIWVGAYCFFIYFALEIADCPISVKARIRNMDKKFTLIIWGQW